MEFTSASNGKVGKVRLDAIVAAVPITDGARAIVVFDIVDVKYGHRAIHDKKARAIIEALGK
jgi:hypothetical protein